MATTKMNSKFSFECGFEPTYRELVLPYEWVLENAYGLVPPAIWCLHK